MAVILRAGRHRVFIQSTFTNRKTADVIGWIGSVAFATCGVPQAWECHKIKSAKGINPTFIGLWLLGQICYVVSVLTKFGWVNWMMFNYIANILAIGVIIFHLLKDGKCAVFS